MSYAELHAHSAFTLLEGADEPHELVEEAVRLGLGALAVLDVDGMHSVVRTASAARHHGLPTVIGAELTLDPASLAPVEGEGGVAGGTEKGWGLDAGAEDPGVRLPVLVRSVEGYHDLCRAMSALALDHPGQRHPRHLLTALAEHHRGGWTVMTGTSRGPLRRALAGEGPQAAARLLDHLIDLFGRDHVLVESALTHSSPPALADALADLARSRNVPLVATTAARCARPSSAVVADLLAATRLGASLDEIEGHLPALHPFLRSEEEMLHLHSRHPQAVGTAGEVGASHALDFRLLAPELPRPEVPEGHTPASWLRALTEVGARERYGDREEAPEAWAVIDHELEVIESLDFPGYFLIVKEIVNFCASRGILCQGRGSAANSAVCFCLGITAVDAVRHRLLFERFLSSGRSGPPDIDVDIEAGRREEVIQHVYERYGRERAAQVATVISYRPRSAVRDVARALGLAPERIGRIEERSWGRPPVGGAEEGTSAPGGPGRSPRGSEEERDGGGGEVLKDAREGMEARVRGLAERLRRLPRHMGIHSGGMVLTRTPVSEICPVQWAATPGRTVLQWDKDDCADAGLVKFDLLGLGALSALRHAFDALAERGVRGRNGRPLGLHNLPEEDAGVYDLLCAADTIGVFQVESRAQMNTLPRLAPRCFYDIVVEVALIRPGPIQGHSVNPYIRRRRGREEVTYEHPALEGVLAKTLGVPLFQEQLMQIAIEVAGFSPERADALRRAMGAKRSVERMEELRAPLFEGMARRGIGAEVAERIFTMLFAFADFGFPESHAFSFAHIVYASAWLKVRHPEHFYAGMLASMPLGFYSPATLVQDARRHGVAVCGADVNDSGTGALVRQTPTARAVQGGAERDGDRAPGTGSATRALPGIHPLDVDPRLVVRLGLGGVRGLRSGTAQRIVEVRETGGPYRDLTDLASRASLTSHEIEALAMAGALECLGVGRREGAWRAASFRTSSQRQPVIPGLEEVRVRASLPPMTPLDVLRADRSRTGVTTGEGALALMRPGLEGRGVLTTSEVRGRGNGERVRVAGAVTHRQRPATGGGIVFLSLEDETGLLNVTCLPEVWERWRGVALGSEGLCVEGRVEAQDGAVSVRAEVMWRLELPVPTRSRDFR